MGYVGDELLYYNFGIIINFVGFRVMGYVGDGLVYYNFEIINFVGFRVILCKCKLGMCCMVQLSFVA